MKVESQPSGSRFTTGFTLTDLIALLAVLGIFAVLVLPALASSQSRSQRAMCLNNLRQMGIAVTVYSAGNNDKLPVARGAAVQLAMNPLSPENAASLGISQTNPASFWTCPSRPGFPAYEAGFNQWILGYQYFGGIINWVNIMGNHASRSPIKLGLSQPHWVVAADVVMKTGNVWQQNGTGSYANLPSHSTGDSPLPQGGNQVFMDGSAQWIQLEKMYFLHSWSPSQRQFYFYQNPKDFPATLERFLSILQATP